MIEHAGTIHDILPNRATVLQSVAVESFSAARIHISDRNKNKLKRLEDFIFEYE